MESYHQVPLFVPVLSTGVTIVDPVENTGSVVHEVSVEPKDSGN